MRDYESGLDGLKPTLDRWKERLNYVYQYPLTVQEVANLRWDLDWIASAHTQFAQFLRSQGKVLNAREHSTLASELYQYIGENSEAAISRLLSGSIVTEELLTLITNKLSKSLDEQTSAEGMHTCPSCNSNLEPGTEECPSCGQGFCSDCGAPINENATACSKCGLKIPYYCVECDSEVAADASVCPNCGVSLIDEESEN
jgi:membrane protease subunit (stomatin/prohibitin family)